MSIFRDNPIRTRDIVGTVLMNGLVFRRADGTVAIAMHVATDAWPVRDLTLDALRRLTHHFVRPVVPGAFEQALAELTADAVEIPTIEAH